MSNDPNEHKKTLKDQTAADKEPGVSEGPPADPPKTATFDATQTQQKQQQDMAQ